MMTGLLVSAWAVSHMTSDDHARGAAAGPDRLAWIIVLVVQSVPYASSLIVSLMSAFKLPASLLGTRYTPKQSPGKPAEGKPGKPEADPAA